MGSFMTDVGKVNIPEDRKDAYIRDAKAVLKQSGLFERSYTQIFGHDVSSGPHGIDPVIAEKAFPGWSLSISSVRIFPRSY